MRISIYVLFLLFASLLNGCGGGGGGSSSSSTSTSCTQSSPCVFSTGVTMNYLRHMFFDSGTNFLYVVDGDSNTCNAATFGRIRKFNADTGSYISTYGGATDVLCPTAVVVLNGQVFATGKQPGGFSGLINMSAGSPYTNRAAADQLGYGLTVANNQLFMSYDNLVGSVVVYNNSVPTPSLVAGATVNPNLLNNPNGLAFDPAGYVYVTHFNAGLGQTVGVSRINTTTYASSNFASSNLFDKPSGIAVRSAPREVYVVNTGTTESQAGVLKISTDGNGNSTGVSTFMSASDLSSKLCSPVGIAISGNNLFIANGKCPTTGNNAYASTILKVTL